MVEQGVTGAVEREVELLAGEDFRGIFAGWAVDSDEAFAKAEDAGLVGGVGGIWGAVIVETGAGFARAETGRVVADGGEVGGVEAASAGGHDALDGRKKDIGIAEVGPSVVGQRTDEPGGAGIDDAAGNKRLAGRAGWNHRW